MRIRELFHETYGTPLTPVFTPGFCSRISFLLQGCGPHAVQLIFGEVVNHFPDFKDTSEKCIFVADKFKNTRLKMFLKERHGVDDGRLSTKMPGLTRWGSHMKTYETVKDYKGSI